MVIGIDDLIIVGTVMAVSTLVTSLISWQNSKDALSASTAERKKVDDLLAKVQAPDFDIKDITPDDYKVVGKFTPEVVPMIEEAYPQIIEKTKDMQEGRSAQMDAIRYMRQLASQGVDPIAEMDRLKGARQAAQEASTQEANIQSNMQRRGLGDSALNLGLQQQAAGDAGYRTAMSGEQAAKDALERRTSSATQAANIGGQVVSQDQSQQAQNAAIINDFNQRMSTRRQQLAELNTQNANQAAASDLANQQSIANLNTQAKNAAAVANQAKDNALKQQQYDNEMNKIRVASGQASLASQDIMATAAANQRLATGVGSAVNTLSAEAYKSGLYSTPTTDKTTDKTTDNSTDETVDEE